MSTRWLGALAVLLLAVTLLSLFSPAQLSPTPHASQSAPTSSQVTEKTRPKAIGFRGVPGTKTPFQRQPEVPKFQSPPDAAKLEILRRGVEGLPPLSVTSCSTYFTLYPGLLDAGSKGFMELSSPRFVDLGIAYFPNHSGTEFVSLGLKPESAGRLYLLDFYVAVEAGRRTFQLKGPGDIINLENVGEGGQSLWVVLASQNTDWQWFRVGIRPCETDWCFDIGDWFFLTVEVSSCQ